MQQLPLSSEPSPGAQCQLQGWLPGRGGLELDLGARAGDGEEASRSHLET